MTKTQLGLFQKAGAQGLDELGEVVADASGDLTNGLVRSAGNANILLNGSGKSRLNL